MELEEKVCDVMRRAEGLVEKEREWIVGRMRMRADSGMERK